MDEQEFFFCLSPAFFFVQSSDTPNVWCARILSRRDADWQMTVVQSALFTEALHPSYTPGGICEMTPSEGCR